MKDKFSIKRMFDLCFALFLTLFLLFPFLIVYVLVKITSPGPAIFWTERIGKNNINFLMPKFRSMRTDTPQVATHLLGDSKKFLTPIGPFLRKSSLDEIPQLWSILKGDMSFVGPRPALFNQYDLRDMRTEKNIHTLVPGLTGWAQINGRDEISLIEKVKFEEEYFKKKSFCFDLKIIFLTFYNVVMKKDISH